MLESCENVEVTYPLSRATGTLCRKQGELKSTQLLKLHLCHLYCVVVQFS